MISSAEWAEIRREIARMAIVLMHGQTSETKETSAGGTSYVATESIDNCPPGNPTIEDRGVMFPYGLVSRAKKDTVSVVARVGSHPGNRLVLGHRDIARPTLGAAGEVALYDAFGNVITLKDGKIVVKLDDKLELGEGATKEAARKGDATLIDATTDAAFFTWCIAVTGVVNGIVPSSAVAPTSVTGKVNAGSGKVTITD
jgi:phage gp45-like